jgi:outer membrane protein assembly factor BamD
MLMRLAILTALTICRAGESRAATDLRRVADARDTQAVDESQSAAREMAVGRYYISKRDYTAAINRFRTAVTTYQGSADVEEALGRLTECFLTVGVNAPAQTAAAVLVRKFPDSRWTRGALAPVRASHLEPVEDQNSWLSRSFK